ncbi:MAG: PSD1 and planctomycete cytochrome C domain-containing protein [Verrucomicrobiales bacterium]
MVPPIVNRGVFGLAFAVALLGLVASGRGEERAGVDFNRHVRPILSDKCFFCHGPDAHDRKADLRLDTKAGTRADLGGYAAVVPGDVDKSELVARIASSDPDDLMPPEESHKKLDPEEIALLTRWVEEGAPYPDQWAYVPPAKHEPPAVEDATWPAAESPGEWIDRFVLARLEEEGLSPSPEADPVTLIRRVHFDLVGLPPTPQAVDDFLSAYEADPEKAWTETVDELFASPHFGERMAVYWLDLVRFADTVGYHGDQDHNISPYRDYVIRSFNENLPFDRFTREQLAGDLLPDAGKWQRVASGYNRLLQTSHEGGIQKKEYDAIYLADRVRNLSAVWMGATVGCAECHDHKYDPYTMRDHYALGAFFADIHDEGYTGDTIPANREPEMPFYPDDVEKRLEELAEKRYSMLSPEGRTQLAELEEKKEALASDVKVGKDRKRKEAVAKELAETKEAILALVPEAKRAEWDELEAERREVEKQGRPTMITVAKAPRTMRVLPRGNWQDDSGEVVAPAVPAFLGSLESGDGHRPTRLDLADWLTDPENGVGGLTARVFANRFWYLFFGTGISKSLSDFGGQGESPANPELLDALAVAFYESGWDVKDTVRSLVATRAYRQSSLASPELVRRDPHNQLVARQSRYRLPAETIRDNALAVSGLLVTELGGASAKPYQPAGYYRHLNFPQREYTADTGEAQWRRGLYTHWQRMFLHPMMKAMDAPSREECTAQRPRSNTPNAALVLLNDPTFVEAARVFAARLLEDGEESAPARLDKAFRLALSRLPDDEERQALENLLAKTRGEYQSNASAAEELIRVGTAPVPENVDSVELASWTAVTRAILNLNETMARN